MNTDEQPTTHFEYWSVTDLAVQEPEPRQDEHEAEAVQELVHFDKTAGVIYLNVMDCPTGYEVDTSTLRTAAGLVDWIYHLRTKPWFSSQHLADFLTVVKESCGDPRNWVRKKG